jgi:four helix bundle protein
MVRTYRDLRVWKAGMDLAVSVYRATEGFPRSEVFGLVSQMRRAAYSIPANIAEGFPASISRSLFSFSTSHKGR